jgi:hypothetical protein
MCEIRRLRSLLITDWKDSTLNDDELLRENSPHFELTCFTIHAGRLLKPRPRPRPTAMGASAKSKHDVSSIKRPQKDAFNNAGIP